MEMSIQKVLIEVNRRYPPSMPIEYKKADGSLSTAKVRFPAEVLESGRVVIWLEGEYDAIDLKNVIL